MVGWRSEEALEPWGSLLRRGESAPSLRKRSGKEEREEPDLSNSLGELRGDGALETEFGTVMRGEGRRKRRWE